MNRRLSLLVLLLACCSAVLLFTRLDSKVVWHDEAYTALRVFGHTGPEYYAALFDGRLHTVAELQAYLHPDAAHGMSDTLHALASRPEHPPLYYLLARAWAGLFDNPVTALRSLSALFGLLWLPAIFWFMREWTGATRPAWVAVALVAASPLHLVYAQESRQYTLWCLLIVASSAALLAALRNNRRRDYAVYAATVTLGLYTHILFTLTLAVQLVYLLLLRRDNPATPVRAPLQAVLAGVLLFLPWLWQVLRGLAEVVTVTDWMHRPLATPVLMHSWLVSLNRLFFDFPGSEWLWPVSAALVVVAVTVMVRQAPARTWRLPLLLLLTAGVVMFPDLVDGGRRSLETRYLLPGLLALQLCVAWLLGTYHGAAAHGRASALALLLLVAGGMASQLAFVRADRWWNKSFSADNRTMAEVINSAARPLLVTTLGEVNPGELLSLSYYLDDHVQLLLAADYTFPHLPPGHDRYFSLNSYWNAPAIQQAGYELVPMAGIPELLELRRRDGG